MDVSADKHGRPLVVQPHTNAQSLSKRGSWNLRGRVSQKLHESAESFVSIDLGLIKEYFMAAKHPVRNQFETLLRCALRDAKAFDLQGTRTLQTLLKQWENEQLIDLQSINDALEPSDCSRRTCTRKRREKAIAPKTQQATLGLLPYPVPDFLLWSARLIQVLTRDFSQHFDWSVLRCEIAHLGSRAIVAMFFHLLPFA